MDIETFRESCLRLPACEETTPFGPDTLVFKVCAKAFALLSLDEEDGRVNLKCDPERALELREEFPEQVLPGYHMNKKHWNTVLLENGLPDRLIMDLLRHSYELVVQGLPAGDKQRLRELEAN